MVRRNRVPESVSIELPNTRNTSEKRRNEVTDEVRPVLLPRDPTLPVARRVSLPEAMVSKLPTAPLRDTARMVLHGIARTGNTILKAIDIPNRVFGNSRSLLQDIYEKSEESLARDAYEDQSGATQIGETAVHLASAGIFGKALPAVFGANVGADTYETAKYAGESEGEALAKGVGHGAVDTAIWTIGQGLASKYLPKAWQWLGRELAGAMRGAASSVTSDAVLNSLGANISAKDMAKRAAHAAWMVPLLGMLKMGGKRREEAMSLLRKARPDLAGAKADKVIETLEAEFSDPKSQKVALAWVARKGANLPDDTAQIRQALEVSAKVKGLDPMSRSPFEILSDPAYARYLPKPKPQDVKAFSNMKRYPMGVIGFDVSDDAAGRQATREMINAYLSPSSNPWCLATGKGAGKLGELGPGAEGYWKQHSAVPKQIFFQEVDGKLELTAFRATGPGGEGRQEYWDTSDAGYSGIPLKVKVPGDPLGRYQKMVFRPKDSVENSRVTLGDGSPDTYSASELRELIESETRDLVVLSEHSDPASLREAERSRQTIRLAETALSTLENRQKSSSSGEVQGTFEDIAPGKVFKGNPFRDGRAQTWVLMPDKSAVKNLARRSLLVRVRDDVPAEMRGNVDRELSSLDKSITEAKRHNRGLDSYALVEDKVRTTENGITKFRTTKYADPTDWDYDPPNPGEQPKPVEIEESELISPEWMRARGYDPDSEADVRRMQDEIDVQTWGNGAEAAMTVVPTRRTYMQTKSGTPETVTYGPKGRGIRAVDFTKDGVSYREEYFPSGPSGALLPKELYNTILPGELPTPSGFYWHNSVPPAGRRLIRNPDSATAEVLNEISWDDSLQGYTRVAGNRRWRTTPTTGEYLKTVARDFILGPWSVVLGNKLQPAEHLRVEYRQPDGTWAPAVDRMTDAKTGETTELPPPPPEQPVMAAKGGNTRADAKGGDAGASVPSEVQSGHNPALDGYSGPRIVINPQVFDDKRDALCVAFNEAFRIVMEDNAFEPVSEPTEKQRRFFADTAYADNEMQLRRTILARIATLDTSVSDPTDEQIQETAEMLEMVMEVGAPQNDWEQTCVKRLLDVVSASMNRAKTPGSPLDKGFQDML